MVCFTREPAIPSYQERYVAQYNNVNTYLL